MLFTFESLTGYASISERSAVCGLPSVNQTCRYISLYSSKSRYIFLVAGNYFFAISWILRVQWYSFEHRRIFHVGISLTGCFNVSVWTSVRAVCLLIKQNMQIHISPSAKQLRITISLILHVRSCRWKTPSDWYFFTGYRRTFYTRITSWTLIWHSYSTMWNIYLDRLYVSL